MGRMPGIKKSIKQCFVEQFLGHSKALEHLTFTEYINSEFLVSRTVFNSTTKNIRFDLEDLCSEDFENIIAATKVYHETFFAVITEAYRVSWARRKILITLTEAFLDDPEELSLLYD